MPPPKVRQLCKDFYGYCTLHGLHFLFDSPWMVRRVIWFIFLTAASCVFSYYAYEGYVKYSKHEVFITTKYQHEENLKFPLVTICNQNMLKKSRIMGKDGQRYLDAQDYNLQHQRPKIYKEMNDSFDIVKEVLTNGHQFSDIVKEIKYETRCRNKTNANISSFFLEPRTGLCHTIDLKNNVDKLGEAYGLSLLLDTEPHEYYGPYSGDGNGFKIMLHAPGVVPLAHKDGIDIPTGFKTTLRVHEKKKIHLEDPYPTKCGTKKLKTSEVYSYSRCILEQYAYKAGEKCGCRMLGLPAINEKTRRYCKVKEVVNCMFPLLYNLKLNNSACPVNCTDISYEFQSSTLVYPSQLALANKEWHLCGGAKYNLTNEYKTSNVNNESFQNWFRYTWLSAEYYIYHQKFIPMSVHLDNKPIPYHKDESAIVRNRYARVKIFFHSKDVELIEEKPAFDTVDFFGNLGGNMGLYLGCSVLTLIEFVDLFVLIIIQWCRKDTKVAENWAKKQPHPKAEDEST